jgi:hypothetical protein
MDSPVAEILRLHLIFEVVACRVQDHMEDLGVVMAGAAGNRGITLRCKRKPLRSARRIKPGGSAELKRSAYLLPQQLSPDAFLADGGTSLAGFIVKKPLGFSVNPI